MKTLNIHITAFPVAAAVGDFDEATARLSLASWRRMSSCWLALVLLPILAAGCAFHEVRTLSPGQVPAERPTVLVLGQVLIADNHISATDKEIYRLKFQEGVEAYFSKTNIFESIISSSTNVIPRSIILSGTITEVNKGNVAAMYFVGMGLGQERVQGDFEIKDAAGKSLVANDFNYPEMLAEVNKQFCTDIQPILLNGSSKSSEPKAP